MKNVILFVLILIVCGSLKKADNKCPTHIVVTSYLKGKMVYSYDHVWPYISYANPNVYKYLNGNEFKADSITFRLK
jgi:hypothetical protein